MTMKVVKQKKGQVFANISSLAISLAGFAIILIVAFLILAEGRGQIGSIEGFDATNATQCDDSLACNSTATLQTALDILPDFTSIIVIAGIGVVLIGLVSVFRSRG